MSEKARFISIQSLSDIQLQNLVDNYRDKGVSDGGTFALREVLLEQRRRIPTPVPIDEIFNHILKLSSRSTDGLLTYGELWKAFFPNRPWTGNHPRKVVGKMLARVIGYCVDHHLPIVTTLVVRNSPRRLDPLAVQNIFSECKDFGLDVGDVGPEKFCEHQTAASKALAASRKAT
jgi:hypothetical protein